MEKGSGMAYCNMTVRDFSWENSNARIHNRSNQTKHTNQDATLPTWPSVDTQGEDWQPINIGLQNRIDYAASVSMLMELFLSSTWE